MARALTLLALIALIALSALGCSESGTQEPEATGTIVFTRGDPDYGAEHVWLMSADGSGQRRLSRGYGPAWSPDGGKIAFSVPRNDETSQINVIGAGGRGRLRLTRPEDVYDTHSSPAWSPNAKTIALQGYDDGHHWIAVVGADGSGQRTLTPRPALGFYELDTAPVWSRDGRTIMFTKESGDAVHAMKPDGSRRAS